VEWTLGALAEALDGRLEGDGTRTVSRVAALDAAGPDAAAFLFNRQYRRHLRFTGAGVVVLGGGDAPACPVPHIVVPDPYLAYARGVGLLHPPATPMPGVHPAAIVAGSARLGEGVSVEARAVVGEGVVLGDHVWLGAGAVVEEGTSVGDYTVVGPNAVIRHHVRIGRRCVIQPGAVIGADGFGFARDAGRWVKIPQLGSVHIGDDVEIGANSSVDRGALRDTVIEDGVKIDNLVQIGHNCHVGAHSAMAGCVGVSGSASIGKRVLLGGGVGVAGHVQIADDVVVTGMTMVSRSLPRPGVYSSGWPVREAAVWRRTVALVNRLLRRQPGSVPDGEADNDVHDGTR
jgi:UDP-3-O-[3-hydroxymyristoyl] glucosamine N-acyltransferase